MSRMNRMNRTVPAAAPAAAIADKMICVDSNSYYGPARYEPARAER